MKIEVDKETIELILDGLRNKIQYKQNEISILDTMNGSLRHDLEVMRTKYYNLVEKIIPDSSILPFESLEEVTSNAIQELIDMNIGKMELEKFEEILAEVALTNEEEGLIQPDESTKDDEPTYGDNLP